jgi:hypothetical protein
MDEQITVGRVRDGLAYDVRTIGLHRGDVCTVRGSDRLAPSLWRAGRRVILAARMGGTPEEFVQVMNRQARSLACGHGLPKLHRRL